MHESNPSRESAREVLATLGFDGSSELWMQRLRDAESAPSLGTLGSYELLEEIGRGGQGIVYRALDRRTQRIVALKRLIAGRFASVDRLHRFETEMKATVALQHRGVVTIYGFEHIEGTLALSMEWVNGRSIVSWASAERTTGRAVSEILTVLVEVCAAVHHAHQRGIIHRDLKPSNILVDADDRPHVLDFGLAKILSEDEVQETRATLPGRFFGTVAYAAPEHLQYGATAADVRSDVFSLGAVFYECLTGIPVRTEDSAPAETPGVAIRLPSHVQPGLHRDLDAILFKSLEKNPEDRYQSVESLMRDFERHLRQEPVEARAANRWYVFSKFVRRHRLALAMSLSFALTLAALAFSMSVSSQRARNVAIQAAAFKDVFQDILIPSTTQRPVDGVTIANILDSARNKLDYGFSGDVRLEGELRQTLAESYLMYLMPIPCIEQSRKALKLLRATSDAPDPVLARALSMFGAALSLIGDPRAIDIHSEAVEMHEALYGEMHEEYVFALSALGIAVWGLAPQRTTEAAAMMRNACDLGKRLGGETTVPVAFAYYDCGLYANAVRRFDEAIPLLRESLTVMRRGGARADAFFLHCLRAYAFSLRELGRYDEAKVYLRDTLDGGLGPLADETIAVLRFFLGEILHAEGAYEEALAEYNQALQLEVNRRLPSTPDGETPWDLLWKSQKYGNLDTRRFAVSYAEVLRALGTVDDAERLLKHAIASADALPAGRGVTWRRHAMIILARCLIDTGRAMEAERILIDAWSSLQGAPSPGEKCAHRQECLRSLIMLYESQGDVKSVARYAALLSPRG